MTLKVLNKTCNLNVLFRFNLIRQKKLVGDRKLIPFFVLTYLYNMKKFVITENEKKEILNLYRLNEQGFLEFTAHETNTAQT
jgi:hypothetical protein